jgi:hypothetical protein
MKLAERMIGIGIILISLGIIGLEFHKPIIFSPFILIFAGFLLLGITGLVAIVKDRL